MLYLARGPQEAIRIGDDITVVVIKVEGNRVALGIQAPKGVGVGREEADSRRSASKIYMLDK